MLRHRKHRWRPIKGDLSCRAFLVNILERRRWMLTCYSLLVRSLIVSPMNFTWSNLRSGQNMSQIIVFEFNRWSCLVRCREYRSRWFWHSVRMQKDCVVLYSYFDNLATILSLVFDWSTRWCSMLVQASNLTSLLSSLLVVFRSIG